MRNSSRRLQCICYMCWHRTWNLHLYLWQRIYWRWKNVWRFENFSFLSLWPFQNQFLFCLHANIPNFIIHFFLKKSSTQRTRHIYLILIFMWSSSSSSCWSLACFVFSCCISIIFTVQKSRYVELLRTTAVNLPHVLTQDLEPTPVLVMKDILEMEKRVKVRKFFFSQPLTFSEPVSLLPTCKYT